MNNPKKPLLSGSLPALLLGSLLLLFSLTACSQRLVPMNNATTFSWLAAYSAPKYYPVAVYTGYFGNEKQFITPIGGSGSTNKGQWGSSASTIITGPEYKEIPSMFSVTWIAFAEKKTYTCEGKLDQQKLLKLFQEGFDVIYATKRDTYKEITVGMAPGGLVSVWLSGAGVITEVGSFQGREAIIDVGAYTPNPSELSREALLQQGYEDEVDAALRKELDTGAAKIPVGLWQTFRKKYNWKPQVELPAGKELVYLIQRYFNGESEVLIREKLVANDPAERAVPKSFQIAWETEDTTYLCRPEMPEENTAAQQSIGAAFAKVMEGNSDEPGIFLMRVNDARKEIRFFVKKGKLETEVTGFKYRIFRNAKKK